MHISEGSRPWQGNWELLHSNVQDPKGVGNKEAFLLGQTLDVLTYLR